MSKTINIMLIDDHAIVRAGYRSLLQKQENMKVISEATDGAQAYMCYKKYNPDIVIMDISMPGQGGLEAITRIKQIDNAAKFLVFSMYQNPSFAVQATRAGALGYVTKSSDPEVLIRAIFDIQQNKHLKRRYCTGISIRTTRNRCRCRRTINRTRV